MKKKTKKTKSAYKIYLKHSIDSDHVYAYLLPEGNGTTLCVPFSYGRGCVDEKKILEWFNNQVANARIERAWE